MNAKPSYRTPWDEDEGGCVVCQRHVVECTCHEDIANVTGGVYEALRDYRFESSRSEAKADLKLLSRLRPYFDKTAAEPEIVHNVRDRRDGTGGSVGSWHAEPLVYAKLGPGHIGRTVIYRDKGRAEAGTLSSWRDGIVFARYSYGDTAAGADPTNLSLAVAPVQP